MANFIQGRQTRVAGAEIGRVFCGGEEAAFVFGRGTQLFPNLPVPIYGAMASRVVLDGDKKWFEMGWSIDAAVTGNAAAGWTDAGGYFRIDAEWSANLLDWAAGKFVPAPVPVVDLGDGAKQYWARAINPTDAAVKTGTLSVQSVAGGATAGKFPGDVRNNPLTALVVADVVIDLPGFPYTMPTDAGRMQTDLAAVFPGSTVTADSNIEWRISIPNVTQTEFGQLNKVYWPAYLVPNMFGEVVNVCDGYFLLGSTVDDNGLTIYPNGFGRLKISAGARYQPYL